MNEKVKIIFLHILKWVGAILRIIGIFFCIASPAGMFGIAFDNLSLSSAILLSVNALLVGLILFQIGSWLEKQKSHKKYILSLVVLSFLWYTVPRIYIFFS